MDDPDREQVVRAEERSRGGGAEELLGRCKARGGVHRLHLDLDQIALRLEPGIGERRDEAEAAVLALRDRQWAVHERDPPMTQLEEVLAGKAAPEDVVDDDRRDVAGRTTMVEQDERDSAVGQPLEVALVLARGVDDDSPHALSRQRIESTALVGQVPVRVADHDRLAVRRGQVLGAACDLGEERVPDVRDDQPDERRLSGAQCGRGAVRHPAERGDRLPHADAGRLGDAIGPVDDVRNRPHGHARALCNVADRDRRRVAHARRLVDY